MSMRVTEYFSGLADVYDANRPSYPLAAIDAALDCAPPPVDIVDVGCGTGISTRLLRTRAVTGARVIGIDPNADMLKLAREATAKAGLDIDYRLGGGEASGLPAAGADVIVVAQAFHWLDAPRALREFNRVLRPGGRLALIWNVRDESSDEFTRRYSEIARRSQADARAQGFQTHELRSGDPTVGGLFVDARLRTFANGHELSLDGLLGRARSASYFPRPGNPLRDALEAELRKLHERFAHDGVVTLWHRTEVTTATSAA